MIAPVQRCKCVVALMALTMVTSCAAPPVSTPAQEGPGERLHRLAREHQVCAAAVAVIHQRQVQAVETASGCDPAWPVRPDAVFQAASLGKPVFAYAVLTLVQQGRLDLDTPVMRYLGQGHRRALDPLSQRDDGPTEEVTDPRLQSVTVRMLLQHTAGLPNWSFGPLHFDDEPGTRWHYSGEGYGLLQRVVESVMGQPLDEVMHELVLAPLGMARSSYRWNAQVAADLMPGTKGNGVTRKGLPFQQARAAFSLYTSVEDYARFLQALLKNDRMLAQVMSASVDVDPALGLRWGLGWGLEEAPDGTRFWQWGNNPGYRAFVVAVPGSGDGVVILTNSDNGMKLVPPLVRAALPGRHRVLESPFVSAGVMDTLCDVLRLCL
jgi:CubicO group peptidase (beta-lactamase class C family)